MPKITIPHPCPASTEQMQPTEQGSFCQQCQKEVIDFRSMSDEAVLRHLQQASGRVCGKFHPSQLDRPIRERPVRSRWRIAGLFGILTLGTGIAQAQSNAKPDTVQTNQRAYSHLISDQSSKKSRVLFGKVLDQNWDPIESAEVIVVNTQIKGLTDHEGHFEIELPQGKVVDPDNLSIEIRSPGLKNIRRPISPNVFLLIQLTQPATVEPEANLMGEIILVPYGKGPSWIKFRHRISAPFRRVGNWLRRH